jgi:hypothetical protein
VMQKIPHGNGLLTFCPGTFNHISRILYMQMNGRHPTDPGNKGLLQHSLSSMGRRVLNKEATSWGAKYNNTTHICLYQLQLSTITTHSSKLSLHPAKWTSILTKPKCRNQLTNKDTKIELHPYNIKSKDGYFLARLQKSLIHSWMEGKKVHSKGSHFAILIHMCLEQTRAYFSLTICGGPDNNAVTLANTVPCLYDLTTSHPYSGPKNAGSMFLWNDSIYPPDKCHIPEDHTLCNTTNYCVS